MYLLMAVSGASLVSSKWKAFPSAIPIHVSSCIGTIAIEKVVPTDESKRTYHIGATQSILLRQRAWLQGEAVSAIKQVGS